MSMTDPVADMLTRIRNGNTMKYPQVDIPASNFKEDILEAFLRSGHIGGLDRVAGKPSDQLSVQMKYSADGERVVTQLKRISKPGKRVYVGADDVPHVMNGLGTAILSTPKGVLTDNECRNERVGGEVLCYIW